MSFMTISALFTTAPILYLKYSIQYIRKVARRHYGQNKSPVIKARDTLHTEGIPLPSVWPEAVLIE